MRPITAIQIGQSAKMPPQSLPDIRIEARGRKDLKPLVVRLPINWKIDPFKDANWCARFHSWQFLASTVHAFDETQNTEYLDVIKAVALDWHHFHCIEKKKAGASWKDKIAGHRAMVIAYLISQVRAGRYTVTADEDHRLQDLADRHLDFLTGKAPFHYNNHTFYQVVGARALAEIMPRGEPRESTVALLNEKAGALIGHQFDELGMHKEHSFGYQAFGIGALRLLQKTGWFEDLQITKLVRSAEAIIPWMYTPDGAMAPTGDTTREIKPAMAGAGSARGVFKQSGYVIVRNASSYLLLNGAFNSRFHKHADDLSVMWFEGRDILVDPGKFSYDRVPMRTYVVSTRAHNTVEIDGENHEQDGAFAYGSAIRSVEEIDGHYRIVASVNHKTKGVTHTRTLTYAPGKWLHVWDNLQSETVHDYAVWFQFAPDLDVEDRGSGEFEAALSAVQKFKLYCNGSNRERFSLYRGQEHPHLQGWYSPSYKKAVPCFSLCARQTGSNVSFGALFVLENS